MIQLTTNNEYTIAIEEVKDTEFTITLTQQTAGGGGTDLAANQVAALNAANDPSLDNPFATIDDLPDIPEPTPEYDPTIVITNHATSITLDETSGNEYKRYTGATDINVTVPNTIPLGRPVTLYQAGAGVITLAGAVDVVLNGGPKTAGQNTAIQILKVADNIFDVIGGVE
jgi:hypothetical protein